MSQPYCTGPVDVWTSLPGFGGGGGTPFFLGWGQRGPRISVRRGWEPVWCDLSGTQIPFDLMYEGQEAYVTIELSKYNEAVLETLQAMPLPGVGAVGTAPFNDAAGERGTMMLTENVNPTLWLRFPFSAAGATPHPAMANALNGVVPAGLRFPGAIFKGPDDRVTGTAPSVVTVVFHCLCAFVGAGQFNLADFNMSALGVAA
jgi:hypothetical protein